MELCTKPTLEMLAVTTPESTAVRTKLTDIQNTERIRPRAVTAATSPYPIVQMVAKLQYTQSWMLICERRGGSPSGCSSAWGTAFCTGAHQVSVDVVLHEPHQRRGTHGRHNQCAYDVERLPGVNAQVFDPLEQ